jgi:mannose-6-phosphate isomerase
MKSVQRPWGAFEVLLETEYCKVKKITVNKNHRLSSQYHHRRNEVWTVVKGIGLVTLETVDCAVVEGQVINIPAGTTHRIKNTGNEDLIFIEVQHGTYFGEDDIVRLEDDYER